MTELTRLDYEPLMKKGFLYAKGSSPVLLAAHLDTVHKNPVKIICYSADGKIVMSPEGLGGDDRAGIFMILQIIQKHRCHVLFCEDEEIGGIGAHEFAESGIKPKVNYIVELDRCGANDAVFYDCNNPAFTEFVTAFGFEEAMGSFSDISIIAPKLKLAAVNLSAGYYNQHTRHEYIDLSVAEHNVQRINKMVSTPTEQFEYVKAMTARLGLWGNDDEDLFEQYWMKDIQMKALMFLPDTAHVKLPNGAMEGCEGQYLLDRAGNVYEFLYHLDMAVKRSNFEAYSENNMPIKFKNKAAMEIEVVPEDFIYSIHEICG